MGDGVVVLSELLHHVLGGQHHGEHILPWGHLPGEVDLRLFASTQKRPGLRPDGFPVQQIGDVVGHLVGGASFTTTPVTWRT